MEKIYPSNLFESISVIIIFLISSGILIGINLFLNKPFNENLIGGLSMILGAFITKKLIEYTSSKKLIFSLRIKSKKKYFFFNFLSILFIISVLIPLTKLMGNYSFTNPLGSKYFIISAIIVGPIAEEIIFRGIILNGLLSNYSTKKSIVISSILFALIHLNPIQIFISLVMGLFFGYLFYLTKNLLSVIILHSLTNLTITICSYFNYEFGNPKLNSVSDIYGKYSIYIISISFLIIIACLRRIIKSVIEERLQSN